MFSPTNIWEEEGKSKVMGVLPARKINSQFSLFSTALGQEQLFDPLLGFNDNERGEIVNAAIKLVNLAGKVSIPTSNVKVQNLLLPRKDTKQQSILASKRYKSNPHPVHSSHYLEEVKKILTEHPQYAKIAVTDRKNALRAVLAILCPLVELKECGQTNKRVFVVKQGKRFRTYGDAIKSGALDELIMKTGTSLLLCGCHKQAEDRYDVLMMEA